MTSRLAALALFPVLLIGCADDAPDPERVAVREQSAREVCIATELLIEARSELETLDAVSDPGNDADPLRTLAAQAAGAAREYARAYRQYAELRAGATEYVDSALRADAPEDSARYARLGARFATGPATPGTVERNVAEAYASDAAAIRSNPAHPCNRLGGDGEP